MPFKSILCGVEGNESSTEAARQAIALARDGSSLHFTAVNTSFELGPDYHRDTLEGSLEEAAALAGEAGVSASYHLREARYAIDVLLPESEEHDLLVLGTHGKSRTRGILFGSTASEAAHQTEGPLLIARQPPGEDPFPSRILLASDGTPGSWAPARTAAELGSAFGAGIAVLLVDDGNHPPDAAAVVAEQVAEIEQTAGVQPRLSVAEGSAKKVIVDAAEAGGSTLIVAGRRGLRGIKALGSVSERIVSGAHSSVLLVPAGDAA